MGELEVILILPRKAKYVASYLARAKLFSKLDDYQSNEPVPLDENTNLIYVCRSSSTFAWISYPLSDITNIRHSGGYEEETNSSREGLHTRYDDL